MKYISLMQPMANSIYVYHTVLLPFLFYGNIVIQKSTQLHYSFNSLLISMLYLQKYPIIEANIALHLDNEFWNGLR